MEDIAARLDDCFALLTGGSRTALARQQTLRATMDWSYGLLTGGAASVCCASSPSLLAAARSLLLLPCGRDPDGSREPLEGLLAELAQRSLVQVGGQAGAVRYSLLETMRQYARDRLVAAGEADAAHDRHCTWYLDQLSQAGTAAGTAERGIWLSRLALDFDNLRAALTLCLQSSSGRQAMVLRAEPIAHLCLLRGYVSEGRRWLGAALQDRSDLIDRRAAALNALATLTSEQGDYREADALYEEALAAYMVVADSYGAARVLINRGNVAKYQGEPVRARELYGAGVRYAREHGHAVLLAIALNNQGTLSIELGDYAAARTVLEESLELKRQSGSQSGVVQVLVNLGEVARAIGEVARAAVWYEEALVLARADGDRAHVALLHYNLGLMAAAQQAHVRAAVEFRAGLREEQELGNKRQIAANLEGLAALAATPNSAWHAGRLLGAATRLREEIGAPIPDVDRPGHQRSMAIVREVLGGADSARAFAAGGAMALDMAIAQALDDAS